MNNLDELLNIIIPFFETYQLRAKKKKDFNLWKDALHILIKNRRKTVDGNDRKKLEKIHKQMQKYKSSGHPWKWL